MNVPLRAHAANLLSAKGFIIVNMFKNILF